MDSVIIHTVKLPKCVSALVEIKEDLHTVFLNSGYEMNEFCELIATGCMTYPRDEDDKSCVILDYLD